MTKISLITVNYNNAAGLQKTVQSVIGQTEKNFEFIIIDGNSTDGSKQVIEKNASRISYWVSEKDKGIYDAMNKGILASNGEYLLFINSGDTLFSPTILAEVLPELNGHEDIVYGNMKIDENGVLSDGFMPDHINLSQLMKDTLWHPVSFIKRELFLNYGLYNTSYKICGDYDFFFNVIISKKVSLKHINRFISVFELNGISSDAKNAALIKEEKLKIQRAYLSEKEIRSFKKKEEGNFLNLFMRWFR